MSTTGTAGELHPDEVTFLLATRLLRGEIIELTDDVGRTWEATASTLSWRSGEVTEVVLERADAFDVLSVLAERLAAASTSSQS